ncbi:MAG TPA: twin-arginine translocase TatA/TatE family subunit [Polyangiaceae bacterium]
MGNIGPGELLIIALIALLLFGAGRIADIGKGLGQGIANFKKGLKDTGDEDEADDEDDAKDKKKGKAEKSDKSDKSDKSEKSSDKKIEKEA